MFFPWGIWVCSEFFYLFFHFFFLLDVFPFAVGFLEGAHFG